MIRVPLCRTTARLSRTRAIAASSRCLHSPSCVFLPRPSQVVIFLSPLSTPRHCSPCSILRRLPRIPSSSDSSLRKSKHLLTSPLLYSALLGALSSTTSRAKLPGTGGEGAFLVVFLVATRSVLLSSLLLTSRTRVSLPSLRRSDPKRRLLANSQVQRQPASLVLELSLPKAQLWPNMAGTALFATGLGRMLVLLSVAPASSSTRRRSTGLAHVASDRACSIGDGAGGSNVAAAADSAVGPASARC